MPAPPTGPRSSSTAAGPGTASGSAFSSPTLLNPPIKTAGPPPRTGRFLLGLGELPHGCCGVHSGCCGGGNRSGAPPPQAHRGAQQLQPVEMFYVRKKVGSLTAIAKRDPSDNGKPRAIGRRKANGTHAVGRATEKGTQMNE